MQKQIKKFMAANPMTQFEVYRIGPEIKIGSFDISFTNASQFMVISSFAILIIFNLGSKKNSVLPNKIQLLTELSYSFVAKMINDTAGSKAKPYFPAAEEMLTIEEFSLLRRIGTAAFVKKYWLLRHTERQRSQSAS